MSTLKTSLGALRLGVIGSLAMAFGCAGAGMARAQRPDKPPTPARSVRVAGIVLKWLRADKDANFRRAEPIIRQAAAGGARLVCTTECFLDGYAIADKSIPLDTYRALGEPIPHGPYFRKLSALARELKTHLVAGMLEADGDARYNTAALIGPGGELVGKYRKQHLEHEAVRNTAGKESSVFATPLGTLGVMICADRRLPEVVKGFCDRGADFLLCPSGGMFGPKDNDPILQARSKENRRYIVFVHPAEFLVTGPDGRILQRTLLGNKLVISPEEVGTEADSRRVFYFDLPLEDRRPEDRRPDWRKSRLPRIERSPDPARIRVLPGPDGYAEVVGEPGAAADGRARCVRVAHLATADQALASVAPDGSFRARAFAPPGSWIQINTAMPSLGQLLGERVPPHIREAIGPRESLDLAELSDEFAEPMAEILAGDPSSSPGTIVMVPAGQEAGWWPGFARRVEGNVRLFGRARPSKTEVSPGDRLELEMELHVACASPAAADEIARGVPETHLALRVLFDRHGRQCPRERLSVSHLLTPTGLPIETHNELVAEPAERDRRVYHPGMSGWPVPRDVLTRGQWHVEGRSARLVERMRIEIPQEVPPGYYGLGAHFMGLGLEHFEPAEPLGRLWNLGYFKVGSAGRPRLGCVLLASSGTGGARGAMAREDRLDFAVNPRNVLMPEKLVLPRDDAYTGRPIVYPLDPYVPMASLGYRPAPIIPQPLVPFDLRGSELEVTVTTPRGEQEVLGPAPLAAGQNDLSVLRPDYVQRDRILPPLAPAYGNPSLTDVFHLTGRGAFDYRFREYGRYEIKLRGAVHDVLGNEYLISGTYDVFVARPLDIEIFPEPGTPLEPGVELVPQVRVLPAMPADVEIRWLHFPSSDPRRRIERTLTGRANRWGVFVPAGSVPPLRFDEPGEYLCDVTVRCLRPDGALWMASRRGASVVVTPGSRVVVHGERGNRSPIANWRARWFLAGDGHFLTDRSRAGRDVVGVGLGHTCYPYESGDVAWLGPSDPFSLFPNLTFEDPEGTLAGLVERRWPGVREGEGREGLYPRHLLPEDRRAIGEMPYACSTRSGLPPTMDPAGVDQWGYFYTTSWRPGVGVRSQVSEDMVPVGYWFFDDPYGYQFGNGPAGDLPGDVKMNYGAGVLRDVDSGTTHYGAYASMLVVIAGDDPRGARVLPPFDGVIPGSPPGGPLLEIGGKRYDAFVTFGAIAPGAILTVGDRLAVSGVVWPPVSGQVRGKIAAPSGKIGAFAARADPRGVFDAPGPPAGEPGLWTITAEAVCSGTTSAGTISALVPPSQWPRGGGLGLPGTSFPVPVVAGDAPPIAFDLPPGSRASPPEPLVVRGQLPPGLAADQAHVLVSLPGMVVDQQALPVRRGVFEYVYDPQRLSRQFPNIDTVIGVHGPPWRDAPAWFDTVTMTFWAGEGKQLRAGMVLLQGEEAHAQASTGRPLPRAAAPPPGVPADETPRAHIAGPSSDALPTESPSAQAEPREADPQAAGGQHSSLLAMRRAERGGMLLAGHPWSGEVVLFALRGEGLERQATARLGGHVRSVAFSPDGTRGYVALGDRAQIAVLDGRSLDEIARFPAAGEPWAVLPSADGKVLWVADFDGDRVLRLDALTGRVQRESGPIDYPSCLARHASGSTLYAVSFRTGEVAVLEADGTIARRLPAPGQLNQCRTATPGPDGFLHMPQVRSDTVAGGRMFDRSVFPAIAQADPGGDRVKVVYSPDLLVVPPHRPVEVAVDARRVYLASAGSDDVVAIDRASGLAAWHAPQVGLEPGAIALDPGGRRLFVLTVTGQEIVTLDAASGWVLHRVRFARDPTPPRIARGRYLFGTATDKRLTKDQWMSCAACHPEGEEDGRQWDLGDGPLDTRSLRGSVQTAPLHLTAHLDEIQDTLDFTRMTMAGQWFVRPDRVHDLLGPSNAGQDPDLDALAEYVESLKPRRPPGAAAALRPLVARGKELFFSPETGCSTCHAPPWYTDSGTRDAQGRFVLHDVGTLQPNESVKHRRLDTPMLLGLRRSAPYLHHGRARTLEDVFSPKFNPQDKHGRTSQLTAEEVRALAEFLRHLEPPE